MSGNNLTGSETTVGIEGGARADILPAGTGWTLLDGKEGNDIIYGGVGSDIIFSGDGHDIISVNAGDDGTMASQSTVLLAPLYAKDTCNLSLMYAWLTYFLSHQNRLKILENSTNITTVLPTVMAS